MSLTLPEGPCDAIVTDDAATAHTAAHAGRHVLFHSLEPDQLQVVEEACRLAGTTFMPAHAWRFGAAIKAVMQRLRDGKLGAPGLVRLHEWRGRWLAQVTPQSILPELDLVCWTFGAMPETVYATPSEPSRTRFLQVHLGFRGGGMALVDYAWGLPQVDGYGSFCLIGATGAAYVDDHHQMQLLLAGGSTRAIKTSQGSKRYQGLLEEFVMAIEEERVPAVTAADTIRALHVASLALDAALAGTALSPSITP